jgi:hypothetical protein
MAKRDRAAQPESQSMSPSWAERYQAAYRAAQAEIADLHPSEAVPYYEGNLVVDTGSDPTVAGRAAAFRDATESSQGIVAQRRLGFEHYQYIFWRARHEHR